MRITQKPPTAAKIQLWRKQHAQHVLYKFNRESPAAQKFHFLFRPKRAENSCSNKNMHEPFTGNRRWKRLLHPSQVSGESAWCTWSIIQP
jgi:hypothetical protein